MKASDDNPINQSTVMTATAVVVVNVEDVNEFTPKFEHSNYEVNTAESLNVGEKVLQVKATDGDHKVSNIL